MRQFLLQWNTNSIFFSVLPENSKQLILNFVEEWPIITYKLKVTNTFLRAFIAKQCILAHIVLGGVDDFSVVKVVFNLL